VENQYTQKRITTAGVMMEAGRYFVARRNEGGQIGGLWEFPGGKHRWGETVEQTLQREYLEEFDLYIAVGSQFFSYDFIHKQTLYHLKVHWVELLGQFKPRLHQHQEVLWAPLGKLGQLPMADSDAVIRSELERLYLA